MHVFVIKNPLKSKSDLGCLRARVRLLSRSLFLKGENVCITPNLSPVLANGKESISTVSGKA